MEEFEKTFDNIVEEYDTSRPMYVPELFKDLFAYSSINSESHVLEIGMGTGKATGAILDSGCHLVGLEPGIHSAIVNNGGVVTVYCTMDLELARKM